MKKIFMLMLLAIVFSSAFCSTSEAKVRKFESRFVDPQMQFDIDFGYDETSNLGIGLSFSNASKNNYWIFSPTSPPQINIDGYVYQQNNDYYHKSGPSQSGSGYFSYGSIDNLPITVLQKITSAKQITITLFFTNQDTLFINVPTQVIEEWKQLIELTWKN